MADPNDTRGFFRKVVNFVANRGADAGDPGRPGEFGEEGDFAKSELKALIERKRRNDFVRKRELDMLRRLRRQGLTAEQLAALGSSSGMADTESGAGDAELQQPAGMKAKIDEIEQQMAGHGLLGAARRPPPPEQSALAKGPNPDDPSLADTEVQPLPADGDAKPASGAAAPVAPAKPPAPAPAEAPVEVVEAVHDPELDEAVMAYANGDTEQAEQNLLSLIGRGGSRDRHAETWMVLFDLYRATGQQDKFDAIVSEFVERFGRSAPQWFSMPKLIAEASPPQRTRPARIDGRVAWVCPERLDESALARLREKIQVLALPWVFDWTALREIEPDAQAPLLDLVRSWAPQALDMRWIGGEQLFQVVADAAPVGVRDADPKLWELRLQLLRLVNRPDRFDEVAIDYCVTYEVSPPSWEPSACQVRVSSGGGPATNVLPTTMVGEPSTEFVESNLVDDPGLVQVVRLELTGQLLGDISEVLRELDQKLGDAPIVEVSCARLLRVDFMAAGDLLNWVLGCIRAGRSVSFTDAIRLVALFFSAIGIDEQARVKVRAV